MWLLENVEVMYVAHLLFLLGERWSRRSNAITSRHDHDHLILLFALLRKMLLTFSKARTRILLIASLKQILS